MATRRASAALAACALVALLQGALALPATPAPGDAADAADAATTTWASDETATGEAADTTTTTAPPTTDLATMSTLWAEGATEAAAERAMGGEEGESAQAPRAEGVLFKLYTREHPITERVLGNASLGAGAFDTARRTFFVIHGFTGGPSAESVVLMRDALLWAEDANVVVVDWEPLAAGPHYAEAAANTAVAARALAARVLALLDAGLPLARVHVLGFSLGAQVAGRAGALLHAAGRRLPRITGLDPARPAFDAADADRLDASDADHVVVLHTAAGFVSFQEPLGHADFYPNGGVNPQPPCRDAGAPLVCSHLVAPRYFAESVYKPQAFRGVQCPSWRDYEAGACLGRPSAYLALDMPPTTSGTFYLRTNALEPYGRGDAADERASMGVATSSDDNQLREENMHRAHAVASAAPALPASPACLLLPLLLLATAAALPAPTTLSH